MQRKALITRIYMLVIAALCTLSLVYVYVLPPESLRTTREGVAFFTPPVAHPESGEALELGNLIRHFRGD